MEDPDETLKELIYVQNGHMLKEWDNKLPQDHAEVDKQSCSTVYTDWEDDDDMLDEIFQLNNPFPLTGEQDSHNKMHKEENSSNLMMAEVQD